jgi:hypothetical protein
MAGLQANWDFLSDFSNAVHWPWMRSVPRRLRVLGVSPAMAAFWTSRVCAPWRRCIFQTKAGRRCPGLSEGSRREDCPWCEVRCFPFNNGVTK